MIRISFRAARDKDVYVLTQNPHDETCGHIEHLRHEIHNLLPLFQNCVWNRWFRMMALRKQNLVPAGRYFFHKPPCCRVRKKESLIFGHLALLSSNFHTNEEMSSLQGHNNTGSLIVCESFIRGISAGCDTIGSSHHLRLKGPTPLFGGTFQSSSACRALRPSFLG